MFNQKREFNAYPCDGVNHGFAVGVFVLDSQDGVCQRLLSIALAPNVALMYSDTLNFFAVISNWDPS
jgi:hypothetical protein